MGVAPSREAHQRLYDELASRSSGGSHSRKRKEVCLLPLTKLFMQRVPQSSPTTSPPAVPKEEKHGGRSQNPSGRGGSPRKGREPAAALDLGAPPTSLPFMQQLFAAYREPIVQYYTRQEGWGSTRELPERLCYGSVEELYAATVGAYEEQLFVNDEAMQAVWEYETARVEYGMNQEPVGAPIRPVPCAICFQYPTAHVASPSPESGKGNRGNKSTNKNSHPSRAIAPAGSVVFGPHCSFMVIGFIGLVPRHARRGQTPARSQQGDGRCVANNAPAPPHRDFLKPPALPPATTQRGGRAGASGAATTDEEEWEFMTFISKSAGEQHLARSLYLASFYYVDQCRRVGLRGRPPMPPLYYSAFITDVPFLCFMREVRLRCAALGWTEAVSQSLSKVGFTRHMLTGHMTRETAMSFVVFLAEAHTQIDYQPTPSIRRHLFCGFVDAASATLLRADGRRILQIVAMQRQSIEGGKQNKRRNSGEAEETELDVCCIVTNDTIPIPQGGGRTSCYPIGTVLRQRVRIDTEEPQLLLQGWELALDTSVTEAPPSDSAEGVVPPVRAQDVLLSWMKDIYLISRVTGAADAHWRQSYSLTHFADMEAQAEERRQLEEAHTNVGKQGRASPKLTTAALEKLCSPPSLNGGSTGAGGSKDDKAGSLHIWEFEHAGRTYNMAVIPNFSRDQKPDEGRAGRRKRGSGSKAATDDGAEESPSAPHSDMRSTTASERSGGGSSAGTYITDFSSHSTVTNLGLQSRLERSQWRQRFGKVRTGESTGGSDADSETADGSQLGRTTSTTHTRASSRNLSARESTHGANEDAERPLATHAPGALEAGSVSGPYPPELPLHPQQWSRQVPPPETAPSPRRGVTQHNPYAPLIPQKPQSQPQPQYQPQPTRPNVQPPPRRPYPAATSPGMMPANSRVALPILPRVQRAPFTGAQPMHPAQQLPLGGGGGTHSIRIVVGPSTMPTSGGTGMMVPQVAHQHPPPPAPRLPDAQHESTGSSAARAYTNTADGKREYRWNWRANS